VFGGDELDDLVVVDFGGWDVGGDVF